jgi:hypothetical protein
VRWLPLLAEDLAVIVIGLLGTDEDTDAMLRFGIRITQAVANPICHEAVGRQRTQCFLPRRIVGKLDAKTGGRQIKTVLFQGRPGAVRRLVGIEVGVVSGVFNLESPGVDAPGWRLRHEEAYHAA